MVICCAASAGACAARSSHSRGGPASPSAQEAHTWRVVPLSPSASSVAGSVPCPGGLGAFPNWPDRKHPESPRRPGCLQVSGLVSPLAHTQRAEARQPPGASAVLGEQWLGGTQGTQRSRSEPIIRQTHHAPPARSPPPRPRGRRNEPGQGGRGRGHRQRVGGRQEPSSQAGGPGVQWEVRAAWE